MQEASRRYLAVFLPFLPSERIKREKPPDAPFALVEKQRGSMRLAAVDMAARALGLAPGLALADARSLLPGLLVFDADSRADAALLDWLADACDRYTPMIATDPPQGLLLDITGCVHPFGSGERGLADDLARRLARLGLTACLSLADTPDAAAALARHGGDDVHALPVAALRTDPDIHVALTRAGLKAIGDVARLPSAPLAARFGKALPVLLARLLGAIDVRITPRRRLAEIETEVRFGEPVAHTEIVLDTIAGLVGDAAVTLSERGVGGRRFSVALFRSDGHVARLSVETGQPVRDPAVLDRLFRERIDTLADPLDPGFGYDMIRLAVHVVEPLAPEQLRLDGGKTADRELAALIDRLGTRLGRNRVRRFASVDTHIPEQSALEFPAVETRKTGAWPRPEPGEPPLRPLHLFDPPHRIEVIAEVPDGPPRRFKWRRAMYEVARHEGPERIAAEWWTRRDNAGLTRDYYRVEDVRGRRYWLFRHGLYGTEKAHPVWYLHGLFA
ncbi:DNA polymerase Y family protein [Sphingomonas sp. SUN039]|nr:DNA polymerase Y family protein [Sphingomonas sp. SUN039]